MANVMKFLCEIDIHLSNMNYYYLPANKINSLIKK